MKTSSFSNALVAVVGAYAEAVGEQAQTIDQLTSALRSAAAPNPAFKKLIDAVDALAAAHERSPTVRDFIDGSPYSEAVERVLAARAALR